MTLKDIGDVLTPLKEFISLPLESLGGFHLLEHRGGWQNLKVDL